jgi:hypothetical protein
VRLIERERHRPRGGRTSVLKVDGKVVASEKMNLMDRTFILVLGWDETFDVGPGTGKASNDIRLHQ